MAMFHVNTFEVPYELTEEFLHAQRENHAIQARNGAHRRLLRRSTGDAPMTMFSVVFEFDDWAAYARYQEAMESDSEWQELFARRRASGATVAGTWVSSNFATEVVL